MPIGAIGEKLVLEGKALDNVFHLVEKYKPIHDYGATTPQGGSYPSGSLLLKVWKETGGDAPDGAYEEVEALKKAHNLVDYGMLSNPPVKLGSSAKSIPVVIYHADLTSSSAAGSNAQRLAKVKAMAASNSYELYGLYDNK